jgi:DNA modification methylase
MGTGATAFAAVQSGRRYVGYELNEAYIPRAGERIEPLGAGSRLNFEHLSPSRETGCSSLRAPG